MTDTQWKLVVDEHGVTIASDRFQLTTNGPASTAAGTNSENAVLEAAEAVLQDAESDQMESIVSEIQTVTRRTYGQFCGLARAMEIIGERWVLLIIRDLLVRAKSLVELHIGLPRIPRDTLSSRVAELERTGIVSARPQSSVDAVSVYELTDYGRELEDIVLRMSRWGVRLLGDPRPEDIVTPDGLVMALRTSFVPGNAHGVQASYELRILDMVLHARIDDGSIWAGLGPLPYADMVIEPGMALKALLTGELGATEAIDQGSVKITGDPELFTQFTRMFQLPPG